jgi:hypothetical protein
MASAHLLCDRSTVSHEAASAWFGSADLEDKILQHLRAMQRGELR